MIAPERIAALRRSRPRVACVGIYIVDVLGRPVSHLPVGQRSLLLDEIRITAAGTGGGTAVDLARYGAGVLAVGAAGDDHIGDLLLTMLGGEGVDTSGIVRLPDVQTSATILPIHPDGSRPAFHVPGANARLAAEQVPWAALEACDALHLGGLGALPALDGAPLTGVLRRAHARGLLVTADCLGVRRDDMPALLAEYLPHVDVFMPNEEEALTVTGAPDASAAARHLLGLGATTVIVKRGERGCLVADADGERALPAHAAPVVDTTGCGDAFCAAVVVALCAGWSTDEAARLGGAAGALTMRGLGSDAGARDLDELLGLLDGGASTADADEVQAVAAVLTQSSPADLA